MSTDIQNIEPLGIFNIDSLFDDQFTIAKFQEAIVKDHRNSNDVIEGVRKAIYQAAENDPDGKETRFVVDLDDELKKAIDEGSVKLVTNPGGEIFAQLRDEQGRFGKKLPIKEELIEQDISLKEVELALQMNAIGEKLEVIIDAINSINNRISDILEGQHNDRLGLYYSGMSLFIEARTVSDELLRKQITAQAIKSLSDATAQIIQELRTSVQYLVTEQYLKSKKKKAEIDERLSIIRQCYDIAFRAYFLKAAIYHENGEIQAMLSAMEEYGRFVEKLIVPHAGKLSELDDQNQFIEKGTWGIICNSLKQCNELKMRISQNHIYYLDGGIGNGN